MFFTRSLPVIVSIFISAGLWALGVSLIPAGERGAYAVLVCGTEFSDREIRERLENKGFTGLVSESGQWVLLDSFGGLEQVALDEYHARILPFDPRNDGYAEKLRSLFVQDDKRFIYIPVKFMKNEKRLEAALEDIPYAYFNIHPQRQAGFSLILFFLAAGAFFAVRPLRSALRPYAASLIPCLPVLAPLALSGAAGFALASLLAGFAALLAVSGFKWFTWPPPYRRAPLLPKLLLSLLAVCYVFLSFFSDFSPVFPLLVLIFVCGILAFSRWNISQLARLEKSRRRFSPVLILRPRISIFAFSWAMLPFAAAALVMVFTTLAASLSVPALPPDLPSPGAVTEADYRAHYLFQSTFSLRALHEPEVSGDMRRYEFASDGLLSQIADGERSANNNGGAIPPFPLAGLVRCLNPAESGGTLIYRLWFILLPLFFIFPIFFNRTGAGRGSYGSTDLFNRE
jgi:hypothetical protein